MTTNANSALAGLARASSGKIATVAEAIASMTAEDLLASLSDEHRTALAASLAPAPAPAAAASEDGDTDDMGGDKDKCSKCSGLMKDGKCSKCASGSNAASASGDAIATARAEERARFTAVMSSEHYKGREKLAATLLATDKLSADEIIAALSASDVAGAQAQGVDLEAIARAEMQAAISETTNSTIDPNTGAQKASAAGIWDQAFASLNPGRQG